MWGKEKKAEYHSWEEYIKHLNEKNLFGIPGLEDNIKKEKTKDRFLKELPER